MTYNNDIKLYRTDVLNLPEGELIAPVHLSIDLTTTKDLLIQFVVYNYYYLICTVLSLVQHRGGCSRGK